MDTLLAAFLLGLGSSLHCVGMCGPIALALPQAHTAHKPFINAPLQYNLGRIFTYATLGSLSGAAGYAFQTHGLPQTLSIALGITLLATLITSRYLPAAHTLIHAPARWLQHTLHHPRPTHLLIGLLNGLLPCGMVYVALAGAAVTSTPAAGAAYMALFGLGTTPLMLTLTLLSRFHFPALRRHAPQISATLHLATAFLLIIRGLDLGIPYLSPHLHQFAPTCH